MSLRRIPPKRFSYWTKPKPQTPAKRRMINTLLTLSEGRNYGDGADKRLWRRLVRMGLVKVKRSGRGRRGDLAPSRITIPFLTQEGDEAVWKGRLPVNKPLPKSKRREKGGRHLRRQRRRS